MRGLLAVGIVLFLALSACKETKFKELPMQEEPAVLAPEQTPASVYEDMDGNPVHLSDFKGKRIFLNYWATWCKPCIEEMPVLQRLQTALSTGDYVFLFASDQSIAIIEKFKKTKDFDLTFIKYNGTWADQDIMALPVSIIYTSAGEQLARFDGVMDWETPAMLQKLKELH
ncbi:redoxin domain-containing protein [Aggregatimonas sangjinii]|uniref:Redoxin domain-containing protein n=1 Tax=Aggregatimonas sangjinii TaxID=2583587 RepID=A0A5B7SSJ8_9FLAO|nr:TlpA family protein disulfide reductase [Aggregatimonas sangjinii]QCW99950.1 redoxin domain-containing protein [Aggregatimonas sangjinii]